MASSIKSKPEKKSAEKGKKKSTKTKTASGNAKRKSDEHKTSNGVATTRDSSSSDFERDACNGVDANQIPNSTAKSAKNKDNQKAKRDRGEAKVMNKFPMERVRRIIRSEDSDMRVTNEAVFLVNIATEKFLEKFCGEAHACCVQDRKKSLSYKHLSSAVSKWKRYDFLSDFVPVKVKAEDALAEIKSMEPEAA